MSGYYALCATAKGRGRAIINGVPHCIFRAGGETDDPEPWRGRRLVFEHPGTGQTLHVLLKAVRRDVTLPVASSGTDGLWTVWRMAADDYLQPGGASWVGRAKQHLEQNTDAADMWGPYSLAEVIRRWPTLARELLQREKLDGNGDPTGVYEWAFTTLAGDDHAQLVLVDSDQDGEPVFP